MPVTIESLAHRIFDLEQCSGQSRHAYTVVPDRVHLARGPHDTIELFLEGENVSFGSAAIGRSLEWGRFHDLNCWAGLLRCGVADSGRSNCGPAYGSYRL